MRQSDPSLPSQTALKTNFAGKVNLIAALVGYIGDNSEYADIAATLPATAPARSAPPKGVKSVDGHVYMIKYGDAYKIGRSDDLERRVKQVSVQIPEKGSLIHAIRTDDPSGIENYWHRRFKGRRVNGEWFKLTPDDVKAFMRRKFQ